MSLDLRVSRLKKGAIEFISSDQAPFGRNPTEGARPDQDFVLAGRLARLTGGPS